MNSGPMVVLSDLYTADMHASLSLRICCDLSRGATGAWVRVVLRSYACSMRTRRKSLPTALTDTDTSLDLRSSPPCSHRAGPLPSRTSRVSRHDQQQPPPPLVSSLALSAPPPQPSLPVQPPSSDPTVSPSSQPSPPSLSDSV